MKHADAVEVLDENGQAVRHTPELIHELFDQELERLQQEARRSAAKPLKTSSQASRSAQVERRDDTAL